MKTELPSDLAMEIAACDFFPQLMMRALPGSFGDEEPLSFFVHRDATFDMEVVRRHLTVMVLTKTRLLVGHTDESDFGDGPRVVTSVESIALSNIHAVGLNQATALPTEDQEPEVMEAWLNVAWGIATRIDLAPVICPDPSCDSDHGYNGQLMADDIMIRATRATDGAKQVAKLIAFAQKLQLATGATS